LFKRVAPLRPAAAQERMNLKESLKSTLQILADVEASLEVQKHGEGKAAEEIIATAEARLQEAEALKQHLAAAEAEKTRLVAEVEGLLRGAAEGTSLLTASLEESQHNLKQVEAALATQKRLVLTVGKAAQARKMREEEKTLLLKDAAEEKIRLVADAAHLETSLSQQTSIVTRLGEMVGGTQRKRLTTSPLPLFPQPTHGTELRWWCA